MMEKKRFGKAFLCLLTGLLCLNMAARAQIIAWTFYNTVTKIGTTGQEAELSATTVDADIETPMLTRGPSAITGAGSARGFTGRFPITPTYYDAILNGSYYEFKVTPKNGKYVSLTTLNATLRPTGGSANTYRWVFSIDGGNNFVELGPSEVIITGTDTNGYPQATIDLSSYIYLQSIAPGTTIIFRMYAWGGTIEGASFGFGKSTTAGTNAITIGGLVTEQPLVAGWAFGTLPSGAIPAPLNATYNNTGIQPTVISRGGGLAAASLSASYASTANNNNATKAAAITNNAYYEINILPKLGYEINLNAITFKFRSLATGPRSYRWLYSTDNGLNFNELGNADGAFTLTDGGGEVPSLLDFSANADLKHLRDGDAVIFRLYLWDNTSTGTVFGFGRDISASTIPIFKVYGTVATELLPVKLTNFEAKRQANSVQLVWQTASEKHNSHFDVIRFEEGKPKKVIGKVTAKGDGSIAQTYDFTDFNPLAATTYYQLSQIDLDGKFTLYAPVAVKGIIPASQMQVSVNTDGRLKAFIDHYADTDAVLSIFDMMGRKIAEKNIGLTKGSNTVELESRWSKGIYIANLQGTDGTRLRVKFIY